MIKNIFKILLLSSVVYAQTYIQGGQLHTPSITSASGSITFNSVQLNNLLDPTFTQDAATKHYVDTHSSSVSVTNNGSLYGSGTIAIGSTAAGTTGQSLIATTGSPPSWGTPVTATNANNVLTNSQAGNTSYYILATPTNATTNQVIDVTSSFLYNPGTGVLTAPSFNGTLATTNLTGVLPIANGGTNNGSLSVSSGVVYYGLNNKINGLAAGSSGQVLTSQGALAPIWAAGGGTGLSNIAAYSTLANNTSSSALPIANQSLLLGTPGFSDTGIAYQITGVTNGYYQGIIQNTSSGTAASADIIVSNNSGTASTYYGDFGINSSTFTGTGSLNLPNATYVYSATGDLTLGTLNNNSIHLLTSGAITDSMTINSAGVISVPQLSSGTIPFINTSNQITTVPQGTSGQVLLSQGSSTPTWSSTAQATVAPTIQKFTTTGTQTGQVFYVSSANATVGSVYTNNTYVFTVLQTISSGTVLYTSCNSSASPLTSGTLSKISGTGDSTITFSSQQSLATYTAPTNPTPLYITVEMVGGGGGGGSASNTNVVGSTGGNSLFSSILANGGGGGGSGGIIGGIGGTTSLGSVPLSSSLAVQGGDGFTGGYTPTGYAGYPSGGSGASTPFGAGPTGGNSASGSGSDTAVVYGAGGAGEPGGGSNVASGSGGGAGGYAKAIIANLSSGSTYYYGIGTGGASGSAGSTSGKSGIIIVTEYYGTLGPAVSAAPQYAQAYHPGLTAGGAYWSTSSSTYADLTNTGTPSLVVRKSNGITVTQAAGNLPGITFTPASANAVYLITAQMGVIAGTSINDVGNIQLTDGTTVIAQSNGVQSPNVNQSAATVTLSGIYVPATTNAVTVKVQGAASAHTFYVQGQALGSTIEWTVTRIDSLAITGNNQGITRSINNVTTSQTLGNTALTDYVYHGSGTISLTMPTAVSNLNDYKIKQTGSGTITVLTTSAQTIDGSSSATITIPNTSLELISDGANWRIH